VTSTCPPTVPARSYSPMSQPITLAFPLQRACRSPMRLCARLLHEAPPLAFPLGSKLLQSPWWISRTPTPTEQRPSLFCANSCPTFKFLVGDMRSGSGGISRVVVLTGGLRGGAGSGGAIRTTLRRSVPAPAPRSGRPALAPPQIDLILLTSSSTLSSFCSCTMAVAG
jgi:hypothetical protein